MRKFLALSILALLIAIPVSAQNVRLNGNITSTDQSVFDASGTKSALKLGTAGVTVDGLLTTGGFDAVLSTDLILCGQQPNNTTGYAGPALGWIDGTGTDSSIGGTACDALDSGTEATADAAIGFANNSFKVYGMLCEVSSSGSNGVAISARSGAAALSTALACSIATSATSCAAVLSSPVTIAAGATVAIKIVNTEDLSAQDAWCRWFIGILP